MQRSEFDKMRGMEGHHWWYAVLRGLAFNALASRCPDKARVLDAGCGTGGMMELLRQAKPGWECHGVDLAAEAVAHCHARGLPHTRQADVACLPFETGSFDAVLSLDVLYHASVDQDAALGEMARVLRKGGVLVLNLPAFNVLRGAHDVAVCGVRRYTACHVRGLLESHSFQSKMIHIHYWNAWLFVPLLLRRFYSRRSKFRHVAGCGSDLSMPPAPVNRLLALVGKVDAEFCRTARLPFGSSVFAIAQKTEAAAPTR